MTCTEDCTKDSDCEGEEKCCYNGCGRSCMEAVEDPGADLPDNPWDQQQQPPSVRPPRPPPSRRPRPPLPPPRQPRPPPRRPTRDPNAPMIQV